MRGSKPGERRGGRSKGTPNKTTAMLKEAILGAATQTGSDGKGKDGLLGYCAFLARQEPKAFAGLLGKVLPMQVTGEDGGPIKSVTRVELVALAENDDGTDSPPA